MKKYSLKSAAFCTAIIASLGTAPVYSGTMGPVNTPVTRFGCTVLTSLNYKACMAAGYVTGGLSGSVSSSASASSAASSAASAASMGARR